MKDCDRGDRIHRRDERSEREALDEAELVRHLRQTQQIYPGADDERRDGCSEDSEYHDTANVLEEVALMQIIARFEDDGWQQDQEKRGRREGLLLPPVCYVLMRHEVYDHANRGAQKDDHHRLRKVLEIGLQHQVDQQYAQR